MRSVKRYGSKTSLLTVLAAAAWLFGTPQQVEAVLFGSTADPSYNTNPPSGALADSGWQFQGRFGEFLGTAVAPHFFLTARHIGGDTNMPFVFDNTNYHPTAWYDNPAPGSDLRLWHVAERLPRYARTYTGYSEVGATLVAFGRGTQRGAEIVTAELTNGWLWGTADSVMRWGSNRFELVVYAGAIPYLYAAFDRNAGPDECHISVGDSGGAAFVLVDGAWQLAGIHYSVDGQFNTTNTGPGFNAALHDAYGLYYSSGPDWILCTNHIVTGFYSSRVSAQYNWLTNTIPDFDSDANGIPDWWEQAYSGDIHGLAATNDPDRDGQDNLAEWISCTDPTNPASFFRVDAVQYTNDAVALTFQGWSNRVYRVYRQDVPPTNGGWSLASGEAFSGSNGPTAWLDPDGASATSRFYRLEASLPP